MSIINLTSAKVREKLGEDTRLLKTDEEIDARKNAIEMQEALLDDEVAAPVVDDQPQELPPTLAKFLEE